MKLSYQTTDLFPRKKRWSTVSFVHAVFGFVLTAFLTCWPSSVCRADTALSASGSLDLRGVWALESDSAKEDPGVEGRIKFDASGAKWRFYSWLEGGWDGAVTRPSRNHSLFKNFDEVYQDNTPYLEFKECYLEYAARTFGVRAGIQRFAWGRLDEYPVNDLLNPWDYTRFLRKSLENRKIGVPSLSLSAYATDWTFQTVWLPWLVPYRLSMPDERWSGVPRIPIPNAEFTPQEPDLPPRTPENGSVGFRARHMGDIEWAVNVFHGYDPRPVFQTTALTIMPAGTALVIDPGYMPDFHRITSLGLDAAFVTGDWSVRAEAAYSFNRFFNIRRELWGYPTSPTPGIFPLNPDTQVKSDTLDYGIGADYRPFEDGLLTVQAQQTLIFDRTDAFYERKIETLLWANLKAGFLNQKIETTLALAYNPEHGSTMSRAGATYIFTDKWKAGLTAVLFDGPAQSIFGRFARNDQVEAEMKYSW